MHPLQYSQVTQPGSSNRCIHYGLVSQSYQRQVLDVFYTCIPFLVCAEKSSSRFVRFRKRSNSSIKCIEYLSLKRLKKRWGHFWIKCICAHRLTLPRPLVSKFVPLPFLSATIRAHCLLVWEWWSRSYCTELIDAYYGTTEVDLVEYQSPVSRIFKLPQFHMGADPIIMSAKWWQGCH